MNKVDKKAKGVVKGAPSGFVISLMVHAAAFLLAGMLVVFTVHQKEDKKFVPPKPVDRPKMKLKKPQVKVKKTSKPKTTTRIVTKVKRASMPDIQLPEMSGMTDGLVGGIGGFEIMPDLNEITIFGTGQTIGNDFEGTFFDFKRDRSGRTIPMDPDAYRQALKQFLISGWRTSKFGRYYRSPKKLYTTTFAVPPVQSALAPEAFGESDTIGYCWAAHYKGQLVYPEDIKFRFWGFGDDVLLIRVDGEVVLNACWPGATEDYFTTIWRTSSADSYKYPLGNNLAVVGDWIELKAGEPLPMEVLIGEVPGGVFQSMLCVQVEGVEYPRNPFRNGPKLPIFKTEMPSMDLVEAIHSDLDPGDASVRSGPIFRDYVSKTAPAEPVETAVVEEMTEEPAEEVSKMRVWNSRKGKSLEAEYVTVMAGQVVVKNARGKQLKIPLEELSEADRIFTDLANPPAFNIDFSKKSEQVPPPPDSPFIGGDARPYQAFDYTFGARVRQKGSREYNHELFIEYFAVAEEVDGDNYKLVDRKKSSFIPTVENKHSHTFHGETARIQQQAVRPQAPMRGTKYGGFLITITDERGVIIEYKASHEWLFENIEKLKKIPVGKHFNKDCERVGPPRPGPADRPDWV